MINKACRSAREALPYGITGSSSAAFDGLAAMKMLYMLHSEDDCTLVFLRLVVRQVDGRQLCDWKCPDVEATLERLQAVHLWVTISLV